MKKITHIAKTEEQEGHIDIEQIVRNQRRALQVIEGICLITEKSDKGELNKLIVQCYKFAHVALGKCKAGHLDWLVELNKTHAELEKLEVI